MIDLTVDLSYLSKYFSYIAQDYYAAQAQGTSGTANEDDNLLTIETEDGTVTITRDLLQKLLQQPEKLAKILMLTDVENRYLIIQELNEEDLANLLPFLSSEELAMGLQFFTADGLENLLISLPTEELAGLVLQNFTMENIAPLMDQKEISDFLENTDIDKNDILEYFEGLEHEQFQAIMMNQFGYEFKDKTNKEYMEYIESMDDKGFSDFIKNMETNEKLGLMAGLCEIEPDYYLLLENKTLVRPMMVYMEKEDIIKSMGTLDAEFLAPMIEELPQNLMQLIATQIDPTVFSKILSSEFPDLIMEMLAG